MDEPVRDVDANLLLSLHALLEERNLTHAGARLAMSQPAMSGALTRLRRHFDDELLVRTGRDFELTPLAERLRADVATAVQAAESLLGAHQQFAAETSGRRFTVAMSEYAMSVAAEPLARAVTARAPGITIAFDSLAGSPDQVAAQLVRRDLLIGPLGFDLPGAVQPVFTDRMVFVVARTNPRLRDGALGLADLRAMPHAVAEFTTAGDRVRPLEQAAQRAGLADRTVAITVASLLTLPFAVSGTELGAFVPSRLADRCLRMLDLTVARTPLETVEITEAAHWHPRRQEDPAAAWLREVLYDVAIELEDA